MNQAVHQLHQRGGHTSVGKWFEAFCSHLEFCWQTRLMRRSQLGVEPNRDGFRRVAAGAAPRWGAVPARVAIS